MATLRLMALVFQLHLKQVAVDMFVVFTVIVQPLLVALLAIFMLREQAEFAAIYVVVGSGLTGLWSGTLFFSAFNINQERWSGTLEQIVASPSPLQLVIAAKSLANTVMSLFSMVFSYSIASWLFDFHLTINNPTAFIISMLLGVLSLIAGGMLIAPVFSLIIGAGAWVNALEFPMFIFGGFLFPILLLPGWTTPISYALAPYWAARAMHEASSGSGDMSVIGLSWALLIAFSLLYLATSIFLFRRLLHKARVDATLSMQ